jgi:Glycosyltransferases involved in cell wall biogenesis
VFMHEVNRGKGAALRTGFAQARGDMVIVQDSDLEYDPGDYPKLLKPLLDGRADVVYGSRFVGGDEHRVLYFWHYVGNRFLTTLSNMFTNLNLTDMETCYKVFRREVLAGMVLRSDRFGIEPELTAKVAKGGWRVYEVGISYSGRSYEDGKKITGKTGCGRSTASSASGGRTRRGEGSTVPIATPRTCGSRAVSARSGPCRSASQSWSPPTTSATTSHRSLGACSRR